MVQNVLGYLWAEEILEKTKSLIPQCAQHDKLFMHLKSSSMKPTMFLPYMIAIKYLNKLYMIIKTKPQARVHMDLLQKHVDWFHGGPRFKEWHTDNAKETTQQEQTAANDATGIIEGKLPAYFHQGNLDAENQMKMNEWGALSLMVKGKVPKKFWGWAAVTQEYLYHFTPPVVD
ncbi:hypothetical protein HDU78_010105 [Chytriomyces hyalinus]|nr:hypothetical protein HDU78_010105 [Chytriomyces hyalinus]